MTAEVPPARLAALPPAEEVNEARAYSAEQVAALLDMSERWVQERCQAGDLAHFWLGRKLRIRHTALLDFLAERERLAHREAPPPRNAPRLSA